MIVILNGEKETVSGQSNVQDLVQTKGLKPETVFVLHNDEVLPRQRWADTALAENDRVEILRFVGGG